MFRKTARFYDAIYSFKDYEAETVRLTEFISERRPGAETLLDVACGTGAHVEYLKRSFTTEALDLDPEMVSLARERHPDLEIHEADMVDFHLERKFDVVVCLFSSIGYVETVERLNRAVATMTAHLNHDGLLMVEPWLYPDLWETDRLDALFVDEPDLKIARMNTTRTEGSTSILEFHYLLGTPEQGIEHFTEAHRLGLFTDAEYRAAFEKAGLQIEFDEAGLMGRGLYVGHL